MTKQKSALQDVSALIDERRQYEKWLAALDARRSATAEHVYQRVHADYQTRLDRVNEQLSTHADTLAEEQSSLESRLALTEGETKLREDERAEVELRAAVGELSDGEVKKALKSVDETLDKLRLEREDLKASFDQVTEFLALATQRPEAKVEAPPAAPAEVEVTGVTEPSPEPVAIVAQAREAVPAAAQAAPQPSVESEPTKKIEEAAVAAPADMAAASDRGHHPADAPPPEQVLRMGKTPRGSFDELRFLNSIVADSPPAVSAEPRPATAPAAPRLSGIVRDDQVSSALMAEIEATERKGGEVPFAANIASNTPIKLRVSGQLEPAKSLKCGECGSVNYPTEWYCERCGAELAAL